MNGIKKRGNKWWSSWRLQGKNPSYSIGLDVDGGKLLTPSASRRAAERISEAWKDAALGSITRKQAEDAIRAIPNLSPKVINAALDRLRMLAIADSDGNMPSIRLYLGMAQRSQRRSAGGHSRSCSLF